MRPPEHPDAVIARLARGQHGLVTIQQARSNGVSYDRIRHRVRVGALAQVDRGIYAVPGVAPTWHQRAMAALLTVGGDAVLYRWSAARAWQLEVPETTRIEVASAVPRGWRPPSTRVALHRLRQLGPGDRDRTDGLEVTSVARTLVDLAGKLEPQPLAKLVDAALARRLLTPSELDDVARRLSTQGRPGVSSVRNAVDPWLRGASFDSVAEAACLRAMEIAGLPAPVVQLPLRLPDGAEVRLDFAWPTFMVALEVDGFRWHANARSHAYDSARANALAAAGWTVLRATPTELARRPGSIMEALRRRLLPWSASTQR
jgi:hypothetical protein